MDVSNTPAPFRGALEALQKVKEAEVQAISGNFAYIWIPSIPKNTENESTGGWIRLPLAFPCANPHGLVTRAALKRSDGQQVTDGHNPGHEMCAPVRDRGGEHYYSWTWEGGPTIKKPEDIIGVVQWYERRIRKG